MSAEQIETFNPWTVVNLVFSHLAEQGLHPELGEHGDPGEAARALLTTMGIRPAAEGNRRVFEAVHADLARIRGAFERDNPDVLGPSAPFGGERG